MPTFSQSFKKPKEIVDGAVRSPRVRIEAFRWDWVRADVRDSGNAIDLTPFVLNYTWQKSLKNIAPELQVNLFPQRISDHILDEFSPMDVIRIQEWGRTVFVGYIRDITYTGMISENGEPQRNGMIVATGMSGLLQEGSIGLGIANVTGDASEWPRFANSLTTALQKETLDGETGYGELVTLTVSKWLDFIVSIGGVSYANYFNRYIDYQSAVDTTEAPGFGRIVRGFIDGSTQMISLHQIISQMIEVPFSEMFADVGPGEVSVGGDSLNLSDDLTYLVIRPTPFGQSFTGLETKEVPLDFLTKFSFTKSMREAYSVFMAVPAAFAFNDNLRQILGKIASSSENLNKYLFKPLTAQLFFYETANSKGEQITKIGDIKDAVKARSETLKEWFEKNDQYLSGSIGMAVAQEASHNPRIGERVALEGVVGSFYVESVAHRFDYGGQLSADISVSRGYNYINGRPIELSGKIFRSYKQAMWPTVRGV